MKGPRSCASALGSHSAPGSVGSRRGVGALAFLAVCFLAPLPASAQFAVYPAMVEFDGEAGVGTQTLTVENQSAEAVEVRVYLSDYDRTEDGGHTYGSFGEHPNSCGERLEAFPEQLAVEPGSRGEVRIRLEPGAGSCWAIVFVEKRTLTASGITMAQRIGVKVLSQPQSAARDGRVTGVSVDTAGPPAALIAFENQGAGALDVEGEIEIRDLTGEIVAVVEIEDFRVLPSRTRRVRVPLGTEELTPGRYVLVAILDFGADYLAGGQAMLEVRP